ncbi:MAG: response regulator [Nitrospiraceae bacterium]|jgi:putative two-component system response regulator|nr:MAG: response regulator [Nitrospiraceae bacterium]
MIPSFSLMKEERRPSVLVVDDIGSNLELMEAIFQRAGYDVHMALSAEPALECCNIYPIDIAILDVMMPGMNGFELCKKLKSLSDKYFFPVILLTALNDRKNRITGIECGADDFMSKPFDSLELLTKVSSLLKLKNLHAELDHSENIIFSLIAAMESRDYCTKGHSTRVGALAEEFGLFLGFPKKDLDVLKKAGLLHDIGKIGLSEQILSKPGMLTEEERELIKKHPLIGERICSPLLSVQGVLPAIRSHHERWDGCGFPDALAGDEIPLIARILAVVDSYDAMVSNRPYRDNRTMESALSVMETGQYSGQWDPELIGLFLKMMSAAVFKEEQVCLDSR